MPKETKLTLEASDMLTWNMLPFSLILYLLALAVTWSIIGFAGGIHLFLGLSNYVIPIVITYIVVAEAVSFIWLNYHNNADYNKITLGASVLSVSFGLVVSVPLTAILIMLSFIFPHLPFNMIWIGKGALMVASVIAILILNYSIHKKMFRK